MAGQGIAITTLAAERADGADALRRAYELRRDLQMDVPALDPVVPPSFEEFVAGEIESPTALSEAFFLAREGDRYVGLSFLLKRPAQPDVLTQTLTGVVPDRRGRGIALALKLRTVRYARAHGYREIRTGNDSRNAPILRINDALGFERLSAWIIFEKQLA